MSDSIDANIAYLKLKFIINSIESKWLYEWRYGSTDHSYILKRLQKSCEYKAQRIHQADKDEWFEILKLRLERQKNYLKYTRDNRNEVLLLHWSMLGAAFFTTMALKLWHVERWVVHLGVIVTLMSAVSLRDFMLSTPEHYKQSLEKLNIVNCALDYYLKK